jgi:hypothetical protein
MKMLVAKADTLEKAISAARISFIKPLLNVSAHSLELSCFDL